MSPIGNLRYLTEDQLVLERRVEAAGKEVCHDATASSWRRGRRPERGPYSPEWVEGVFSELRPNGVLGSLEGLKGTKGTQG
jgi:hypothetical protein